MKGRSIVILVIVLVLLLAGAGALYLILAPQAQEEAQLSEMGVTTPSESDQEAPDFTVTDQEGAEVTLGSMEGKPVIINFWTSWCTYCKQEMADLEQAYQTYGDRIDFMIVDVTTDSKETMAKAEAYIEDKGFDLPFYFDTTGDASSSYHVTVYPTTYLISSEGVILGYHPGLLDEESIDMICRILVGEG